MPSVHHSTIRFFRCYQLPPEVFVQSSSVRVTEVGSHTRPTTSRQKWWDESSGMLRAEWTWSSDHPTLLTSFPLRSFPAPHFVWGDRNVPTSVCLPWVAPRTSVYEPQQQGSTHIWRRRVVSLQHGSGKAIQETVSYARPRSSIDDLGGFWGAVDSRKRRRVGRDAGVRQRRTRLGRGLSSEVPTATAFSPLRLASPPPPFI